MTTSAVALACLALAHGASALQTRVPSSPPLVHGVKSRAALRMYDAPLPDSSTLLMATGAVVLGTALIPPLVNGALRQPKAAPAAAEQHQEEELCELVSTSSFNTMHQPVYADETEEDWWTCPEMTLDTNPSCRELYHDGETTVACAF